MYLQDFFEGLALLRKPEFLDPALYPALSAKTHICYGYRQTQDTQGAPCCLLFYCEREAPQKLLAADITKPWLHREELERESVDLENGISKSDSDTAFLEALWLFDAVSCTSADLIHLHAHAGIKTARAIALHTYMDEESVLALFDNNIFLRDLSFSQAKYFVKRYIKASPLYSEEKAQAGTPALFEKAFAAHIDRYYRDFAICGLRSARVTGKRNPALDDFIEQLEQS